MCSLFKKKYYYLIALFLILLTTIVLWSSKKSQHQSNANSIPTVSTIVVRNQNVADKLQAIGTVKASQSIQLNAEVSGVVQAIYFHSGQSVTQGQLLMTLRCDDLSATLDKLKAKWTYDKKNYDRSKRLLAEHVVSIAEYDASESTFRQDQAEVNRQKALLLKYQVRAPFSGVLGIDQINIGQFLAVGQNITTLDQLDLVYVDLSIPERLIGKVRLNSPVAVHTDAYPDQYFSAHIAAIASTIDLNSRSLALRLEVSNPDKKLLSGMAVTVTIKQDEKNAVLIPESAISYEPKGAVIYLVDKNNTVHCHAISFLQQADGWAAVRTGVQPGDILVASGQLKLHDGMSVHINNEETL